MAKGASTEGQLGSLHAKLTALFTQILDRYERQLDAEAKIDPEAVQEELLEALLADTMLPSPAMLSAIAKFLKDNEITLESETVSELSEMEERLAAKQRNRPNLKAVVSLPLQVNE